MPVFGDFARELLKLVEKYEKSNTPIKIEEDLDNDIIKIYGEKISTLARAKNGLNDVTEMAYTSAEHHPYWNILYQSSEIASAVLEKWDEKISKEEIFEIEWSLKQISQTLEKIKEQN